MYIHVFSSDAGSWINITLSLNSFSFRKKNKCTTISESHISPTYCCFLKGFILIKPLLWAFALCVWACSFFGWAHVIRLWTNRLFFTPYFVLTIKIRLFLLHAVLPYIRMCIKCKTETVITYKESKIKRRIFTLL
jgi:hypothetical protein